MIAASANFTDAEVARASHSLSPVELGGLRSAMQHTLNVLEKVRAQLRVPVQIVSFARSPAHNVKVKGAPTSDHLTGYAADVIVLGGMTNAKAYEALRRETEALGIDQLIYDPTDKSLHVGTGPRQRHQAWIEVSSPVDQAIGRLFGAHLSDAQKLAAMGFTGAALLLAALLVFTSENNGGGR